jgi:hypothetical protein
MEEIPFDSKRRLCPDGACVGVLGADGRCSVCRRVAGASPAATEIGSDVEPETDDHTDDDGGSDQTDAPSALAASASGFDSKRRLCEDGSCVGIVGADGVCGSCGRKVG